MTGKKGTSFFVRLPLSAAEPKAAPPQPAAARTEANEAGLPVVLVIDDDPTVHDIVRRSLGKQGFQTASAYNGADGLRLARELRPHAITLDVLMPEMDGWDVLSQLKSDPETAAFPVIMLTLIEDKSLGYTLGASDYLTKPLDRDALTASLSAVCNARGEALVVDDDPVACDLLRRALEGDGWKVRVCPNGLAALDELRRDPPQVILLDLMMPEMDGFTFLERFREEPKWAPIPIIVITASELTAGESANLNGAVARVMTKGRYSRDELLGELAKQLRSRLKGGHNAKTVAG